MVVEILWPETAPWWLNLFIWMALFWYYILVGFIPGFYIAFTKLFGMPLLQRWSNEVVIMLYPNKVRFGKITQQMEPYFKYKKGVYWISNPLQPVVHEEISPQHQEKLAKIKLDYEELVKKEVKTKKEELKIKRLLKEQTRIQKRMLTINPANTVHIYTHAVNQSVYDMERRKSKVDEILNSEAKIKKIPNHSIWILQNLKSHFHRHYQLIVDPSKTMYKLIPVKDRQQFAVGFWHSIGVIIQQEVQKEEEIDVDVSSGHSKQLVQTMITTHVVLQQMKEVQEHQNFSASKAHAILKKRGMIEDNFYYWLTGSTNPVVWLLLIGMVASVGLIFYFLHGSGSPPPTTSTPTGRWFG